MTRTAAEYRALMDDVAATCRSFLALSATIADEDIDAAIRTVEQAEAVGFVVDPTAFRDRLADGGLLKQRQLLRAFRDFRGALRALGA